MNRFAIFSATLPATTLNPLGSFLEPRWVHSLNRVGFSRLSARSKAMDCSISNDLLEARTGVTMARRSAAARIDASIAAAASPANARAFVKTSFDAARSAAHAADRAVAEGRDPGPLAGLAVSIKDLFDVTGETTAAGSAVLADAPAATTDAPAVARLRRAGAAFIGRSNMSEFAFSAVGINPHYGTPANPAAQKIDAEP